MERKFDRDHARTTAMPMTVVVVRDVADRYRGFLASIMPEVATGVFTSPEITKGVRERVWTVLSDWWSVRPGGSIVMVWKDDRAPGGLGVVSLGEPTRALADIDGVLVTRRE
jgi:CRISPR-associated protein Cas2